MKKLLIMIAAALLLIGMAGALPNFGPAQGFSNKGSVSIGVDLSVGNDADVVADLTAGTITSDAGITAATEIVGEHIYSTDDLNVSDDMLVGGDLTVTGSASIGGGYIASGSITDDLEFAANKGLSCAAGTTALDLSAGTGVTKTTTGAITIGGGTNGISLNGPVTGASAKNWTMVGASYFIVGSGGIDAVGGTATLLVPVSGTSAIFSGTLASGAQTVTGGVTASGTVTAEQITSTDDMQVADDLTVLGDLQVSGSYTTEDLVATDDLTVGDDADVVGTLTAGDFTSDSTITATTTVTAEQLTSTDDATIAAELTADDLISTNDTTVGGALDVDGATTLDGLTVAESATFNEPIIVDKAIGTAPFTITSTTVVPNLNVDQMDGKDSTDFALLDGTQELSAAWDVGSYGITAETFTSDVTTGSAPFVVASTTVVSNLNAEMVSNKSPTDFVLVDGTQALTADWDTGDYDIQTTDLRVDVDASVAGAFDVDGATTVDGFTAAEASAFSDTVTVTGLTTISAIAVGVNATTTVDTTITSTNLTTLYPIDASGASVTLTLPAGDTVTGRPYWISADADMGANNIILATTGAAKLGGSGGADTLTSTDATAAIQLVSDGTNYQIVGMRGTWT